MIALDGVAAIRNTARRVEFTGGEKGAGCTATGFGPVSSASS